MKLCPKFAIPYNNKIKESKTPSVPKMAYYTYKTVSKTANRDLKSTLKIINYMVSKSIVIFNKQQKSQWCIT